MKRLSEYYDKELEEIKRRKLLEYQRMLKRAEEEEARRRLEAEKEALLRRILTPKARQRLANLKLVKPQFVESLELQLIQLAQTGRVEIPITDKVLKQILIRLTASERKGKIIYYR
ncbi:MAG: DNA-binding protein [Thermoprotei archaeon]|nr:MAG: DNA-binding protein [Thermofilum sp. ex4484_79]RLE61415.1 MAG: DNA-binding protein [Thermoprotei archaeon]